MSKTVYDQFNRPKTIPTHPGDMYLDVYQEENTKKGKEILKTGKTCVYDMIQADLEQSKIENILHKVAMGDLSVLNQREGFYVDATEYPKNLMEAQNIIIKAQNEFNEMPQEVRELFHNSPDEYVEMMGTKEFVERLKPYTDKLKSAEELKATKAYNERVEAAAKFNADVAAKGVTTE